MGLPFSRRSRRRSDRFSTRADHGHGRPRRHRARTSGWQAIRPMDSGAQARQCALAKRWNPGSRSTRAAHPQQHTAHQRHLQTLRPFLSAENTRPRRRRGVAFCARGNVMEACGSRAPDLFRRGIGLGARRRVRRRSAHGNKPPSHRRRPRVEAPARRAGRTQRPPSPTVAARRRPRGASKSSPSKMIADIKAIGIDLADPGELSKMDATKKQKLMPLLREGARACRVATAAT